MRSTLGNLLSIRHGNQVAAIQQVGAGLFSYTVDGKPIASGPSEPTSLADVYKGSRGHLLMPWPNRIKDGRYEFNDTTLQLPINEVAKGHASHGFARVFTWNITKQTDASLTLQASFPPQVGYPFTFDASLTYHLSDEGLRVDIAATNTSGTAVPFGVGMHPYFTSGTLGIDDDMLRVNASAFLEYDTRSIPTGESKSVNNTQFDLQAATPLRDLELDITYTNLQRDANGHCDVTLTNGDGATYTTVWMDEAFNYIVVFTGDTLTNPDDRRKTVAIEPLSCAPDAFNNGLGLSILQPEERFTGSWGIKHSLGL